MKKDAVLFYSRDFLSQEFPRLADQFTNYERVYVVTNDREKRSVLAIDEAANIYDLRDYFDNHDLASTCNALDYKDKYSEISKDRFIRRMPCEKIENTICSVSKLILDIDSLYSVKIYFDEPVSAFVNHSLNKYVRAAGGITAQISLAWVPGYIFFVAGENQDEPLVINTLVNGQGIVNSHAEKRLENKNKPRYVVDYNSKLFTLKQSVIFFLKGLRRDIISKELYLNSDSWPHYFQSKCLLGHALSKYTKIKNLNDKDYVGKTIAIYPLHYEPEAILSYYSEHKNQVILLEKLLDKLPPNHVLVVKEHPSQPGALSLSRWDELRANKRVVMIRGTENITDLFKIKRSYMLSIASTAILEALLHEVPVYVFGKPYFYKAPGTSHVANLDEFEIPEVHKAHTKNEFLDWYGNFLNEHCVSGQFLKNNTILPDMKSLIMKVEDK